MMHRISEGGERRGEIITLANRLVTFQSKYFSAGDTLSVAGEKTQARRESQHMICDTRCEVLKGAL